MRARTVNLLGPILLLILMGAFVVGCEQSTKTSSGSVSSAGGNGGDGAGGGLENILWKPQSESDGNVAVLMSKSQPAGKVGVYYKARTGYDSAKLDGSHNGRQVWRLPRPGAYYEPSCELIIDQRSYTINNPSQRQGH